MSTADNKSSACYKSAITASTQQASQDKDGFLSRLTGLTRAEQKATKEFIAARVVEAKNELNNAESALQVYKEKNKIIGAAGAAESSVNGVWEIGVV